MRQRIGWGSAMSVGALVFSLTFGPALAAEAKAAEAETAEEKSAQVVEDESPVADGATSADSAGRALLQTVEVVGREEESLFAESTFSADKTQTHLLDVGQSISIITKEVIRDRALVRLNDIAPFVAGVNEFSVYNDLTIRGFRNDDDRRINGLRAYNNFWSQELIAHVERVEVIKGPAAATFGDASPGGVINIVTKKPLPYAQTDLSARYGGYTGYSGSTDQYLALDTTGPFNDQILYRFNMAYEDSESFRTEIFNENLVVAPSLSFLPTDRTRINFDLVYTDSQGILDRGQPTFQGGQDLNAVPIEVSVTQPGDKLNYETLATTIALDQEINASWSFALAYMHFDYEEQLEEHRIDRFVSPTEISLRYNDRDSEAQVDSASAYVVGRFETGRLGHKLIFGVDTVKRDDEASELIARNVATFDLSNPANVPRDVGSYDLVSPSYNPWRGSLDSRGVYISDVLTMGPWDLTLGLRYDDFEVGYVEGEVAGRPEILVEDSQLSPRVSLVRRMGVDQSAYFSWLTGFQPPPSWTSSPVYGGPFDPRESDLFEVGYKQLLFHGRALFVASLFRLTLNNEIVYANDENNPDLYIQRGEERSTGLELEFSGRVTDALQLIANYAYIDAEIVEDPDPGLRGKRKENAPEHTATLWGRYDLNDTWGFGAGVSYVSERETFEETLQLPSYTLFDAAVYYQPTEKLELSLQGKNLSDRTHWTGGYNYGRVFPGEPRTYSLVANYRF
jgi:iron complex outermembrane recepter protein